MKILLVFFAWLDYVIRNSRRIALCEAAHQRSGAHYTQQLPDYHFSFRKEPLRNQPIDAKRLLRMEREKRLKIIQERKETDLQPSKRRYCS